MRKPFFVDPDTAKGPDVPQGVMLIGVQGCGKSLAAKSIAGVWGVPLLKLDFGALFNKYIGETERNLREALKSAEMLSPCVLWIDEIEQAIVSAGYWAHAQEESLATDHILRELANTQPLSVVRAESIATLRAWAEGRTVRVD